MKGKLTIATLLTAAIAVFGGGHALAQCPSLIPDVRVTVGGYGQFAVERGGQVTLTAPFAGKVYQWYRNGAQLTVGGRAYTIAKFGTAHEGFYTLRIDGFPLQGGTRVTAVTPTPRGLALDSLALVDFYHATNGPNWSSHIKGWLQRPLREWTGVGLKNCRVTSLKLPAANLLGTWPNNWCALNKLEVLDVSQNSLSGNLAISCFRQLVSCKASYNQFSIFLPSTNVTYHPYLRELAIDHNQMVKSLMLQGMPQLRTVLASHNRFASLTIPSNAFTTGSPLSRLDVSNNALHFDVLAPFKRLTAKIGRGFIYSPQNQVPIQNLVKQLFADVGGYRNRYELWRGSTRVATYTGLSFRGFAMPKQSGLYHIRATNYAAAPGLVVYSQSFYVWGLPFFGGLPFAKAGDGGGDAPGLSEARLYPNPAQRGETQRLQWTGSDSGLAQASIVSVQGQPIWQQDFAQGEGAQSIALPTGALPPGSYFVVYKSWDGEEEVRQFVIQ